MRMDHSKLTARLRLFGLLALLVPLFAGLQVIVHEGVPRVEVRLVAQDVQTTVPVQVPVERVVERVVYVTVGGEVTVPPTQGLERGQTSLASDLETAGERDVQAGGPPPGDAVGGEPEVTVAAVVEEQVSSTPQLTGTVAITPPPPAPAAAAPAVVARAAPAAPISAPIEYVYVPDDAELDEETVASEEPEVAMDDDQVVAEAESEAPDDTTVLQFVSEAPMIVDGSGSSIGMLRHELFTREPQPQPAPEAATEEPEAVSTDDQPADVDDGAADVPDAEAPVDEATPISTETLLAESEGVTPQLGSGPGDMDTFGVHAHQLVARPAGPAPIVEEATGAEVEEAEPGPDPVDGALAEASEEPEEQVAEASEEPEQGESVLATEEVEDDEAVADANGDVLDEGPEVARAEEGQASEEEPEQ